MKVFISDIYLTVKNNTWKGKETIKSEASDCLIGVIQMAIRITKHTQQP